MTLQRSLSTGDVAIEFGAVDIYWGRCGRICDILSLLRTLR